MGIIKKIIILTLFVVSISFGGERKVLVEMLTNTFCTNCILAHATLNNYLSTANSTKIEYIFYHMPFPYSTDELNKHNKADSEARNSFYGPYNTTPTTFFNGAVVPDNTYNNWKSDLDNLVAQDSPFNISLSGEYTQSSFTINALVSQTSNIANSDLTINYVVVEDVNYNNSNKKNVMRKIVDPAGTPFTISLNETKNLDATINFHNDWIKNNLKVIVFIQSKSQKTVYQSESISYSELTVTDVKEETNIVDNFRLYQNYPNPFNPTTTIQYSIPTETLGFYTPVQLIVYDILGNEITTLVNEEKSPGNYEVTFDASYLSNGVYYYQLKSNNFVQTKKMILIK